MNEQPLRQKLLSLAERVRDDLLEFYRERIVSVVLYGSVARGDCHESSDINILAVFNELPEARRERYSLVEKALRSLNRDVEILYHEEGILTDVIVLVKSVNELDTFSPLYLDMTEDAVVLYDKDWFFTNKIAKLRSYLKEKGAQRVWIGRLWYWKAPHVVEYAPASLQQSRYHLEQGRRALQDQFWNVVVREAIESITFSIRALLRAYGIEIPGHVTTATFLKTITHRFHGKACNQITELAGIFKGLHNEWDFSFYTDEWTNKKKNLFTRQDAETALADASRAYELARAAIGESTLG